MRDFNKNRTIPRNHNDFIDDYGIFGGQQNANSNTIIHNLPRKQNSETIITQYSVNTEWDEDQIEDRRQRSYSSRQNEIIQAEDPAEFVENNTIWYQEQSL